MFIIKCLCVTIINIQPTFVCFTECWNKMAMMSYLDRSLLYSSHCWSYNLWSVCLTLSEQWAIVWEQWVNNEHAKMGIGEGFMDCTRMIWQNVRNSVNHHLNICKIINFHGGLIFRFFFKPSALYFPYNLTPPPPKKEKKLYYYKDIKSQWTCLSIVI